MLLSNIDIQRNKHQRNRQARVGYFLVFLFLFFGTACDNFLDEVPDNRVALDDLEKAGQLLTNAYSISSYAFTDWMTDDVGFTRGTNIRPNHNEAYTWQDFTADPNEQDTPIFFWFQTYNAIAHANEVLAILEDLPADTDELQARKRAIESEALLTRAYGHFMLVNLFGKHYDESSSSSDPGVPFIETPETVFIGTYSRSSVKEVYDKVETDMLRGIELVDDNFFENSGKYHFNRNAALAFASRFYLFKGDYDKCIEYSNQLLGADPSVFVRDLTSDEFQSASSSIQGYPQLYSSPDLPSNLMLMRKISLVQRTDFGHAPTNTIYNNLFATRPFTGVTDQRENPAFVKGVNGLFPVRYESLFQRSGLNSNVGFPYHIALAFRGEEVLLNRAEAYIQRNRIADAIADLQVLTDNRYSGGDVTLSISLIRNFFGVGSNPFISDRVVLLEYYLLEKRKEFIAQGMRWFDIKRYDREVQHVLGDNVSVITLQEDDRRKVLQIPQSAIDVGGLKPNPR
ncbi:RagB/SusD family nutrient uptake outer membrane protein [Fulvivirgaceae bacterium BMA10]|uniref:RagB/SusD family nutrient uptake outer membrane protein n=1 Tax=Splendidivirga corallicola TaxID=3051826 RepID=A0ABT8KNP5_9BACT|nr:RagB/SusD family nutrient uptake outer membrane protein [Fulvivirgaceae bacterium BMA10]